MARRIEMESKLFYWRS